MSNEEMSQLDNIPKKQFFSVPEDYFEDLPAKIQARAMGRKKSRPAMVGRMVWRYALAAAFAVAAVLYYRSERSNEQDILASVESQELIDYLQETGMSTEELLETVDLSTEELQALEDEVYIFSIDDLDE